MQAMREEKIFTIIEPEMFAIRLARSLREGLRELAANPGPFLYTAFLGGNAKSWLPVRFFTALGELFSHPLHGLRGVFSADAMALGYINPTAEMAAAFTTNTYSTTRKVRRSRLFKSMLVGSAALHFAGITVALYLILIAPYAGMTVVNKPYRPYDDKLIAIVPTGGLKLNQKSLDKTLSLEEIQERERKRREEAARRKKEEEERKKQEEARRKAEEERIAREKAEQEAKDKAAAQAASAGTATTEKPKFGEINEAPIKDILSKVYALHQIGFVNVDTKNLSMMFGFTVEKDGSISNIKTIKSSGNNLIDKYAKEILWNLGESHALSPLHVLSSNTIRLDLTDKLARLSITGFAPSEGEADMLAKSLNLLFTFMRMKRKNDSPDVAELLSHMKVTSTNKRVDADLTVSNERAGELMKAKFGKSQ